MSQLENHRMDEIKQTVQFEPFSSVPLPTEKKSLGGFKGMFR